MPVLSVVIPALDQELALGRLLRDLRALPLAHEVVVADGGSDDGTVAVAAEHGARVVLAARGRGRQLAAGADAAAAPLLCFLPADVRLGADALLALARIAQERRPGSWTFRLRIGGRGGAFRVAERVADLGARWLGLPLGDAGLVVWRDDYRRAGGFPAWPLLEELGFARALRAVAPLRLLPAAAHAAGARWQRRGFTRRALRHGALLAGYFAGVSPDRLAGWFGHAGTAPAAGPGADAPSRRGDRSARLG